eukprot:5120345-Lingulodinium_polyedra.AAC.1
MVSEFRCVMQTSNGVRVWPTTAQFQRRSHLAGARTLKLQESRQKRCKISKGGGRMTEEIQETSRGIYTGYGR